MSEKLVSTLAVNYEALKKEDKQRDRDDKQNENTSKYYIVLEQVDTKMKQNDDSELPTDPYILIHCYPPDVKLSSTSGVLTKNEVRIAKKSQAIHFNGSDGVRLQYPHASNVVITLLGNFLKVVKDKEGNELDLVSTSPNLDYDEESNSIVSEDGIEIYGSCYVTYDVSYQVLNFAPNPIAVADFNSNKGDTEVYFGGVIFGKRVVNNRVYVSTLEIKLDPPPKPIEFARVYSKIVLDADGPHEAPKDWPDNTSINPWKFNLELRKKFPNRNLELKDELDPENSFTDERVHLMIMMSAKGQLSYEFYSHRFQDPFDPKMIEYMDALRAQVFGGWGVQYIIKFAEAPGGKLAKSPESFYFDMYNLTWRDLFLYVDKNKLYDKLKANHYPNLIKEVEDE